MTTACLAVLVTTAGCSSSGHPKPAGTATTAAASTTPAAAPASYTTFAAVKNALVCEAFVQTVVPANLGQSTDNLTAHGAQDWQACHVGDDSFLIVQFDSPEHAAAAKDALADGAGTWSYGISGSPFVIFMIHPHALDYVTRTLGPQGAGPAASASATSSSGSFFAVDGAAKLVTSDGYTMTLHLTWNGAEPRIDVGSNPPGKTDILVAAEPFTASLTDTTVGGRALPTGALPAVSLVALYPASSAVCAQKDDSGNPDDSILTASSNGLGGHIRTRTFCGVRLVMALGDPWVSGHLDVGSFPNGTPVAYTYDDLADAAGTKAAADQYAQPVEDGPSWRGVSEKKSAAIRNALAHPVAFGLDTYDLKPQSTFCRYPNEVSGESRYVALLASNAGTAVPGC